MFGDCLAKTIDSLPLPLPDVAVLVLNDDGDEGDKRASEEIVHVLRRHLSQRLGTVRRRI
jgi:hypothetical protein